MFNYSSGLISSVLNSLKTTLNSSSINISIYSGTQPTTANDAVISGRQTLLGTIKKTDGSGLQFVVDSSDPTKIVLEKVLTDVWQFTALASGTANWLRIAIATDDGAQSYTELRMDGAISTSTYNADVVMPGSTAVTAGSIYTINSCAITWGS